MAQIVLPWPPASLSGHNTGHWRTKAGTIADYRMEAFALTKAGRFAVPVTGDIRIHFRFVPPDRRGDRTNFAGRLKPQIDGIAQALGINDRRFLPSYEFCEPEAPGRVEVEILGRESAVAFDPGPAMVNGGKPTAGHGFTGNLNYGQGLQDGEV